MDLLCSEKDFLDNVSVGCPVRTVEILTRLTRYGIAFFRGVDDASGIVKMAQALGTVLPHPDSDTNSVTVITERRESAGSPLAAGFTRSALPSHTDRADLPSPPALLMNLCTVQADSGGESIFVDGSALHRLLAARAPRALHALSQPDAVSYGNSRIYTGPVFEPTGDGRRLVIRMWPQNAGRFSRAAEVALRELRQVAADLTLTIRLEAGQGYVVDNHRWLHGRLAYIGNRVMLRIGIEPHPGSLETGISFATQGGAQG
ncbi:TauD/TfdA family dioxygenase [Streptomyces murinus]|uniref:Alpha-ketoglutarate-dependent taurine dioxygenase n=1 Tax=Streptomyces murinus TaxID=33900 RepID=A0A7W3NNT3_STRMR|nr:alpha-ketoglutarate-dependent taurine dioxygenase [Streptomyces murinus]